MCDEYNGDSRGHTVPCTGGCGFGADLTDNGDVFAGLKDSVSLLENIS